MSALRQLAADLRQTVAHDYAHRRAAVMVVTDTILLRKIQPYTRSLDHGISIDWRRLAADIDQLPWSSGERALARAACHLAGVGPAVMTPDWLLSEMVSSIGEQGLRVVLAAIQLASGR